MIKPLRSKQTPNTTNINNILNNQQSTINHQISTINHQNTQYCWEGQGWVRDNLRNILSKISAQQIEPKPHTIQLKYGPRWSQVRRNDPARHPSNPEVPFIANPPYIVAQISAKSVKLIAYVTQPGVDIAILVVIGVIATTMRSLRIAMRILTTATKINSRSRTNLL